MISMSCGMSERMRTVFLSGLSIRRIAPLKRSTSNLSMPKARTMRAAEIPSFMMSADSPIFSMLRRLISLRRRPKRATG